MQAGVIESARMLLRPIAPDDTATLIRVFGGPGVTASFAQPPFTLRQLTRWVERNLAHQRQHGYGLFTIVLKAHGQVVGDCGLAAMRPNGHREVELGYDRRRDYWDQGLASEAAAAVRDYAFTTSVMPRLVSLIRQGNLASRRLAEKLGMSFQVAMASHGARYWLLATCRAWLGGSWRWKGRVWNPPQATGGDNRG